MNVYDFDKTIFYPDSSVSFILFCMRHYPRQVLRAALPALVQAFNYYVCSKRKDAKGLKEALFSFLNRIDNVDQVVLDFWDVHFCQIADWYLQQKKADDLIISASPEFLLRPATDKLGVRLIATKMNPYTGKILGKNCHDEEKCRRFLEFFSSETIEAFYSDSLSDTPMANLAEKAFLISGAKQSPWPGHSIQTRETKNGTA